MMGTHKNIQMLETVAAALGELLEEVVFVGGATTALYIDDPAAPSPTPSDDVDFVVQVGSKLAYDRLENRLRQKGFKDPDSDENAPICRKYYKDIKVDVMPTDEKILGFSNRWYKEAIQKKRKVSLPSGIEIAVFSLPYFVATKLIAYNDRGKTDDPRVSQDLEDICAVLDGSTQIENEVNRAPKKVKEFIRTEFAGLLENEELFEESAHGFIRPSGDPAGRAKRIVRIARAIAFPDAKF
jgi:hypothetical protein